MSVVSSDTSVPQHPIYHVSLETFEGPLDLLLHLIKENKMDIRDIQISLITQQYLQTLDNMQELNLEIAAEFLVMAATLAHIKSKMLLPAPPVQEDPTEEGKDPRDELVRRLLEYQKYKHAAESLEALPQLGRDVFTAHHAPIPKVPAAQRELAEVSVFKLINLFADLSKRLEQRAAHHRVVKETVSLKDCVHEVVMAIRQSPEGHIRFRDLIGEGMTRRHLVVTFLAVLNLIKLGAIRIFQSDVFSDIELIGNQEIYDANFNDDIPDEYDAPPTDDDLGSDDFNVAQAGDAPTTH